jgi:hypothetical protein
MDQQEWKLSLCDGTLHTRKSVAQSPFCLEKFEPIPSWQVGQVGRSLLDTGEKFNLSERREADCRLTEHWGFITYPPPLR